MSNRKRVDWQLITCLAWPRCYVNTLYVPPHNSLDFDVLGALKVGGSSCLDRQTTLTNHRNKTSDVIIVRNTAPTAPLG